ncbi:hypothetical protein DL768_007975 [Monosporascus sp. mg162]|nr:hypothetical protein DL768_007975 [Monosporascus sp. mg162]
MSSPVPTVFAMGVTGYQGGAVSEQPRKPDRTVHATVRKLESYKATTLASIDVKLTKGIRTTRKPQVQHRRLR